jgi:radical SAM protein with 4Fe4S-binding SPASM domain
MTDALRLVFWELTARCNLTCKHCRAEAQDCFVAGELSTDEILSVARDIREAGDPIMILTGGEPLVRDDIYDIASACSEMFSRVALATNGTLIDETVAGRIAASGIQRASVSIDGADAATHDANRGVAGSFDYSMDILRIARELDVETQINTTLTPANLDQIEAMADRFATRDIALWSVFFLIPVGRATEMERLNADECEQAFERLWLQSRRQPYMIKTTEAPHYRRYVIQHAPKRSTTAKRGFIPAGVNDGKGVMFVSHTGEIFPTGFLPIPCGDFPSHSVVDVYQNSPTFKLLRDSDQLQGKCGQCEFRNVCGGSRARAYGVTGNPLAEEPDCIYVPAAMTTT